LPSRGDRPGVGNRPPVITTLPSNRPDIGGRPGIGSRPGIDNRPVIDNRPGVGSPPGIDSRPGISTLPSTGLGSGRVDRPGDRQAILPGLGDRRPGVSQLPANRTPQERRDALSERLGGERPANLPARDWNQVRNDWQDHRNEIRNDWQQHRDEARDDWQNWFDEHYPWHGGWYWGHAPGYWGRWDYLWDNYPVAAAVGLTWWAANSLGYQFGYGDYYNPYYQESWPISYAEPVVSLPVEVPAEGQPPTALPPGVSQEGITKFEQARAAFLEGKYNDALKLTDEAVAKMPRDAVLHEFRSLVLFALKRYPESAAAINAVLAVGPGWDWKTLSSLYPDVATYTGQLQALENYRDTNPKSADARFLTGYHYLTCGHADAALRDFRRALEIQPKDAVTAALVASLSPRDAQPGKPPPDAPAPKAVKTDDVTGAWTATGSGSSKYAMNLGKDGTFKWSFSRGRRKEEVKGVYSIEGNVLAMEPDSGGVMLAELTTKDADKLLFKMIGGKTDDPGLDFRRESSR
jgi:tetratricopeptide (TPR) repeat protein